MYLILILILIFRIMDIKKEIIKNIIQKIMIKK
jgi:hypothetical protein